MRSKNNLLKEVEARDQNDVHRCTNGASHPNLQNTMFVVIDRRMLHLEGGSWLNCIWKAATSWEDFYTENLVDNG